MKAKYIIGGLIIIVFIIWGSFAFLETTVTYVSFAEARTATRSVQVAGHIDFDDVDFNDDKNRIEFSIYEMDPEDPANPDRMKIIYEGIVPGNFDQATSVVAVGKPVHDGFLAEKLLVKCPSKYQGLQGKS